MPVLLLSAPHGASGRSATVSFFPSNLLRTWHLQLAIFWIATAYIAGGLFLAVVLGGREPQGLHGSPK